MSFLAEPRKSTFREVSFQIHLWGGILLTLAISLVSLTGSLLVYRPELVLMQIGPGAEVNPKAPQRSYQECYEIIRQHYPGKKVSFMYLPNRPGKALYFLLRTNSGRGGRSYVYMDPATGKIVGVDNESESFIGWMIDLHENLLAGKNGLLVNGAGAILLAIVSFCGLVVWWPGIVRWRQGFVYQWRARWKRQNYDLHKVGGFVSSAFILLLAVTGAYFAFPDPVQRWSTALLGGREWVKSPAKTTAPAASGDALAIGKPLTIDQILVLANRALPAGQSLNLRLPTAAGEVYGLRKRFPDDWQDRGDNWVWLNQYDGSVIRVDDTRSMPLGVRLVKAITPVHLGEFGGGTTKILWTVFGFSIPILAVTGVLMYWNRYLSKKWRRWKRPPRKAYRENEELLPTRST